jgi:tRNA threonylcarbamoyladenosine biosynthesis protein TsaB
VKLLALDTSTEACTVALLIDGRILERFELGMRHAERILSLVDEVLAEGGVSLGSLDALAFGRGPGSFTGLRIGAGVVQGLAFGTDRPVVPVSSLAALAQGQRGDRILAAFDARMQQVYWGAYVRTPEGMVELSGEECVVAPDAVPLPPGQDWCGAGSGWDVYHAVLTTRLAGQLAGWTPKAFPRAGDVARLALPLFASGRAVRAEEAVPVYIRDEVAVKQRPRDPAG